MKRNPVTNLLDKDMFWDYILSTPEATYSMVILFTDLGTPDGYWHMNGYGINTYKMVNAKGEPVYPVDGIKNLTLSEAKAHGCADSDYASRDLFNTIASGKHPSWTFYIQVMTFEEAENLPWNPFDPTKVWPEERFRLIEVGNIILQENPTNVFTQIEQIAFDPGNMIAGIEISPDRLLQGRVFAYSDAQRYRLGANFNQLPPNCPFSNRIITNYERDGHATFYNQDGAPNYYPNSFGGPENDPKLASSTFCVTGDVERYNTSDEDNFSQASDYWNTLTSDQKENMKSNLASYLEGTAPFLQEKAISMFSNVNKEIGDAIRKHLKMT
ncbi:Catalase [Blattella germanica]|nr:Catalase [Blattella germanica]